MVIEASNIPIQVTSLSDSALVNNITAYLKSQGTFDQFRKECLSDVDTKPAYQNLHQRVESTVTDFLRKQVWKPSLNKNQLRDVVRKHISDSGFLKSGIDRIIDQVVNPKIYSVFLPVVEDVVIHYLGMNNSLCTDTCEFLICQDTSTVVCAESERNNFLNTDLKKYLINEKPLKLDKNSKVTNGDATSKINIEKNNDIVPKSESCSAIDTNPKMIMLSKDKNQKKEKIGKNSSSNVKLPKKGFKNTEDNSRKLKELKNCYKKCIENVFEYPSKKSEEDNKTEKNKEENISKAVDHSQTKVHDDHGSYRDKGNSNNKKPDKDGKDGPGSDSKNTPSLLQNVLIHAETRTSTKHGKRDSSKNNSMGKEHTLKIQNVMLTSPEEKNDFNSLQEMKNVKQNFGKECCGKLFMKPKDKCHMDKLRHESEGFSFLTSKKNFYENDTNLISTTESLCTHNKMNSDNLDVKFTFSKTNPSFSSEISDDLWIHKMEQIISKMKKFSNTNLSALLPDDDDEALSFISTISYQLNESLEMLITNVDDIALFDITEENLYQKVMKWKAENSILQLENILNNVDNDGSLSEVSVSSVETADLSEFEDIISFDMTVNSHTCSILKKLGAEVQLLPASKNKRNQTTTSHKRKSSSNSNSDLTKKYCMKSKVSKFCRNKSDLAHDSFNDSEMLANEIQKSNNNFNSFTKKTIKTNHHRSPGYGMHDLILHVDENEVIEVEIENSFKKYKDLKTVSLDVEKSDIWNIRNICENSINSSKKSFDIQGGSDAENYVCSSNQKHLKHTVINENIIQPIMG